MSHVFEKQSPNYLQKCFYILSLIKTKSLKSWEYFHPVYLNTKAEDSWDLFQKLVDEYKHLLAGHASTVPLKSGAHHSSPSPKAVASKNHESKNVKDKKSEKTLDKKSESKHEKKAVKKQEKKEEKKVAKKGEKKLEKKSEKKQLKKAVKKAEKKPAKKKAA